MGAEEIADLMLKLQGGNSIGLKNHPKMPHKYSSIGHKVQYELLGVSGFYTVGFSERKVAKFSLVCAWLMLSKTGPFFAQTCTC